MGGRLGFATHFLCEIFYLIVRRADALFFWARADARASLNLFLFILFLLIQPLH